jgi:CBS domain-containing protein
MLWAMLDLTSHSLEHIRVRDCLSSTPLTCDADAALTEVARLLSHHRVHAVLVRGDPIAVVADRDLIRALKAGVAARARDIPVEAMPVPDSASLSEAVMLLNQHDTTHLIAVDQAGGGPVGILSASDILAAYAATGSAT